MKKYLRPVLLVVLLLTVLSLTGCLPGDGANTAAKQAGFFSGVWHGWVAPVSLIVSIFRPEYSIYEVHNSGLLYGIGFYAAIISGFGGLSLARNKFRRR